MPVSFFSDQSLELTANTVQCAWLEDTKILLDMSPKLSKMKFCSPTKVLIYFSKFEKPLKSAYMLGLSRQTKNDNVTTFALPLF